MKNKFLEIAGVATEEEFYNMFPSEEAFFQAYPEARQMKKGGNVPTNPQLYSRVKAEAKKKFDRWPSAYGSAWLVKTYKEKGGGYRKGQFGGMMGGINPENPFAGPAMNIMRQNQQQQGSGDMMNAAMQFAPMLLGMPPMADGGKMPQWLAEKRFKAAGREDQLKDYGYMYGGDTNYMQQGGEQTPEMKKYLEFLEFNKKARQAIGTNDKKQLQNLGFNKPYNSNDLAKDFGRLQQLRKAAGLGVSEEASILFPHVGQQMRSTVNSWLGTNFQNGGEPDGEMAMGQIMAMHERLSNLQKFINADTDLDPWVSSKITLADDYINAVSDYLQYGEDQTGEGLETEEEDEEYNMGEMEEMAKGGIPQRYKNKGFTKVGVKRKSTRPGKKWMVLAKKGDKYKVVHGGYKGMKDFSQHGSKDRKDKFWSRMGGKDSAKAKDPFSPLYWHKKFKTWQEGGEIPKMEDMMTMYNPYEIMKKGGIYIKPENEGNFTRWAEARDMSAQEAASKVMANTNEYPPAIVKMANFAKNAAGWKKQMGGMMSEDMDMDSMYTMMRGGSKYQQGGERENQIMQAIQMYAQMTQTDPQELIKQIQALPPLEQEEAIQKIIQAIQQAQSPQASQMQMGGGINMGDTMDLDEMEIQRLMDMGYGVEYID